MRFLSIKSYAKHQHYKDRRPPWIKLHVEVLDDYAFTCLQDASKAHLMLLWVLASKMDNRIPYDLPFLTRKLGTTGPIDVEELVLQGFIEVSQDDGKALAPRKQSAMPETEGETETEAEAQKTLPRKAAAGTRTVVVTGPPFALAPYLAAHEDRFPGATIPTARFGRVFKGLERKHGPAETLRRWTIFLAAKGELGPEYFARTWSEWAGAPSPRVAAVGPAPADEEAWSAALDVVARMVRREITAETFREIPASVRAGLKAIGGWTAVRDMKPGDLPFRRRDFLTAYHAAEMVGAA